MKRVEGEGDGGEQNESAEVLAPPSQTGFSLEEVRCKP